MSIELVWVVMSVLAMMVAVMRTSHAKHDSRVGAFDSLVQYALTAIEVMLAVICLVAGALHASPVLSLILGAVAGVVAARFMVSAEQPRNA